MQDNDPRIARVVEHRVNGEAVSLLASIVMLAGISVRLVDRSLLDIDGFSLYVSNLHRYRELLNHPLPKPLHDPLTSAVDVAFLDPETHPERW